MIKSTAKKDSRVEVIRHVTMVGFWLNCLLVILKLFFGYWGHSDALVADGYHSVSDFITDIIVIVFAGAAYKKADAEHPYGHGKFETLATVLVGIILLFVGIYLLYEGIVTIITYAHGEIIPRPDIWTIIVALISILLKEWCYRYTRKEGLRIKASSLMANAMHHRSDAVSSIATLIGVILSFALGESWRVMDPIASIVIAGMIGYSAYEIAKPAIEELLEVSLPESEIDEIRLLASRVSGVINIHNLRARRNGHSIIIEMNVHVDPDITIKEGHRIANRIEKTLRDCMGDDMIIYIHIEPEE
ncbi:MAG: cation diffusion facilitator family transporter [Muribaculaceae bacterium]|nr:cation diffusion facilitator family transporter [Muribaculaceae bacterium]